MSSTGMTGEGGAGMTKWSICFCHPIIAKKTWIPASRAGMTLWGVRCYPSSVTTWI
ncbi:MAG: polymerase basic protein 2 [Wolbachia pipientis]|nr:polymerase basic protein 2 [Wolbachia pipientis]